MLRCPPATEINFRFSFAKSSNFLLSPISSQEKRKARCNRCPTYLRLWSLTTLCSQKSEMVSEGAPVYLNLQCSEPLCFPRGLASALHPWDFKGTREVIFYLPLQFPSPLPLDSVSPRCDVSWDRLHAELLWTISKEKYACERLWFSLKESEWNSTHWMYWPLPQTLTHTSMHFTLSETAAWTDASPWQSQCSPVIPWTGGLDFGKSWAVLWGLGFPLSS